MRVVRLCVCIRVRVCLAHALVCVYVLFDCHTEIFYWEISVNFTLGTIYITIRNVGGFPQRSFWQTVFATLRSFAV